MKKENLRGNKMNNVYFNSSTLIARPTKNFLSLKFFITLTVALLIGFSSFVLAFAGKTTQPAQAADPVKWFMCLFGEDAPPAVWYQLTQSSDLQFQFLSKSAAIPWSGKVDGGLNSMLEWSGQNFKDINESILGTELDSVTSVNDTVEKEFNNGPRVSPYDRFGVAGLNYTYYMGEWKYVIIDACGDNEPVDPKAGLYYAGRLEPNSTWEDIPKTKDVRTAQFGTGVMYVWPQTLSTSLSNIIFSFTKFIVVTALVLIGLAFTDIINLLGIDSLLTSGDGIMNSLFQGLFMPFVVLAFALTGLSMMWKGIVKKQYRESLNVLFRSLALFFGALLIAAIPLTAISIPNNIAIVGQSLIMSSLDGPINASNQGLCYSTVGEYETTNFSDFNGNVTSNVDDSKNILDKATDTIVSSVSCQFWENFLLKPWVDGQWGAELNHLWANDNVPDWAPPGHKTLGNVNDEMVGNAAVPLGNNEFIHNWAIFQLSTQTNAHSPLELDGQLSKYSSGVANDWWRIVDANANYEEETLITPAVGSGPAGDKSITIEYDVPKNNDVTEYWDDWTGNNPFKRPFSAVGSLIVAGIGLLAPLLFSLLSAVYSIGITLLMAVAPIVFLIGIWGDKGWEIFKSWSELVINLTLKRIGIGLLLALSLIFTSVAIQMMNEIGWWRGVLALIFFSIILISARKKIVELFANVRFASVDITSSGKRTGQMMSGFVRSTGRAGGASIVGGVTSKAHGGSFVAGAARGIKTELRNITFANPNEFTRNFHLTGDDKRLSEKGITELNRMECHLCGAKLSEGHAGKDVIVGVDSAGNHYCKMCFEDGTTPEDTREVVINLTKHDKNKAHKAEPPVIEDDIVIDKYSDVNDSTRSRNDREAHFIKNASINIMDSIDNVGGVETIDLLPDNFKKYIGDEDTLRLAFETDNNEAAIRMIAFAIYRAIQDYEKDSATGDVPLHSYDEIYAYLINNDHTDEGYTEAFGGPPPITEPENEENVNNNERRRGQKGDAAND